MDMTKASKLNITDNLEEILNLTQVALNEVNKKMPLGDDDDDRYYSNSIGRSVRAMIKSINGSKAKTQAGYDRNVMKHLSGLYGSTMEPTKRAKAYRKALVKAVGIKFFWETMIAVERLSVSFGSDSKNEKKYKHKKAKLYIKLKERYTYDLSRYIV